MYILGVNRFSNSTNVKLVELDLIDYTKKDKDNFDCEHAFMS